MLAEASAFVSSLSAIRTLGSALVDERDRQKAAAIQVDLSEKILQAQAKLSEVLATIIDKDATIQALRDRVRELEAQQAEKARYTLAQVGTVGQFFAYQLRPVAELAERANEPPHFLCQPCFDAGKKSVLHFRGQVAICHLCKVQAAILPAPPAPPIEYRSDFRI